MGISAVFVNRVSDSLRGQKIFFFFFFFFFEKNTIFSETIIFFFFYINTEICEKRLDGKSLKSPGCPDQHKKNEGDK